MLETPLSDFLAKKFVFLGIEFQNWMVLLIAVVLLYAVYRWIESYSKNSN